jgi:nickel/cobalt exporter
MPKNKRPTPIAATSILVLLLVGLIAVPVLAQAPRNPFAVGGQEVGGNASGIAGWILAKQSAFYQQISGAVRAAKQNGTAFWSLAALSFAYGVFHAAGPGHGKAVVASYMLANERALRRGLIISAFAALLQGLVAIAVVGLFALLLHATARSMNEAATDIDLASFAGIAALGLWLVVKKGRAFVDAWRRFSGSPALAAGAAAGPAGAPDGSAAHAAAHSLAAAHAHLAHHDHAHHGHDHHGHDHHAHDRARHDHGAARGSAAGDGPADDTHGHDPHCGHFHAPDPNTLGAGFSWRSALLTVVAAGSRPCAGAILVLVFALSQGVFWAGVGATLAMSLGTAITTGTLAAVAVLAKGIAVRMSGIGSRRSDVVVRGLELAAALVVLVFGVGLFFGLLESGA